MKSEREAESPGLTRRNRYQKWYFEDKYGYRQKRQAIERFYGNLLSWAESETNVNVFDGSEKLALDVGCAYGFVVDLLSKFGYRAFGVDISDYALTEGKNLGVQNMIQSDASHLPFGDSSFDLVTCFEVLEHLYDPERALCAISALTKHGGTFVMTTPKLGPVAQILTYLVAETHSGHPSMKQPEYWIKRLEKAGFGKMRSQTFSLLPVPPTIFNRYFTVDCRASLASHVRLVAQKD